MNSLHGTLLAASSADFVTIRLIESGHEVHRVRVLPRDLIVAAAEDRVRDRHAVHVVRDELRVDGKHLSEGSEDR